MVTILAIDPGSEKCGVAVASRDAVLMKRGVRRETFLDVVLQLVKDYNVQKIVVGDGTGSDEFLQEIRHALPDYTITTIDESLSSEEARRRYWKEHPPKGWRRLIPMSMQVPPEPYDDYVAVILAERFFGCHLMETSN